MSALFRSQSRGQSLVLVALVLPVMAALLFSAIEVAARYLELAAIQDALRSATRSAVQTFRYDAFAENAQILYGENNVKAIGKRIFLINLTGAHGIQDKAATVEAVQWTVLPNGGTCTFPNGRPPVTITAPAVCATLRPTLNGLLGWGTWSPQIDVVETLDRVDTP